MLLLLAAAPRCLPFSVFYAIVVAALAGAPFCLNIAAAVSCHVRSSSPLLPDCWPHHALRSSLGIRTPHDRLWSFRSCWHWLGTYFTLRLVVDACFRGELPDFGGGLSETYFDKLKPKKLDEQLARLHRPSLGASTEALSRQRRMLVTKRTVSVATVGSDEEGGQR